MLSAENLTLIEQPHPASSHNPALPACLSRDKERMPNYKSGGVPQHFPLMLCVFCTHSSAWDPLDSLHFGWHLFAFVLYQEVHCEKSPSEKVSKVMFPLLQSSFFSGYIFHKRNLSLITAWPWRDLKSQNLIIHIGLQGYPVEPSTENCSQLCWWMAMQPLSVFLQWQGTK